MVRLRDLLIIAILTAALLLPVSAFALPQKGLPAPPLRIVTTSGQKVTLANYKGYVLVVEFFATWCGGCNESIPHLVNLNKLYGKKGLQILALNPGVRGDNLTVVRRFIREKGINFPVALVDDDVMFDYAIQPIPAIFIIDKNGILVQHYIGFNPEVIASIETTIKNLLAQ